MSLISHGAHTDSVCESETHRVQPNFDINTAMGTLKPKAVSWALEAWTKLRERKAMILKGWAKIGLGAIFNIERQQEALVRLLTNGISIDADDSKSEPDIASASDDLELMAEDEECNENDAVEEDEEEVDMDISISACLEEKAIAHGVRRSN